MGSNSQRGTGNLANELARNVHLDLMKAKGSLDRLYNGNESTLIHVLSIARGGLFGRSTN
jgi:hypothetical protein